MKHKIKNHKVNVYIVEGLECLERVDGSEKFFDYVTCGNGIGLLFCDTVHKAYDDGWRMAHAENDFSAFYDAELSGYDDIYAYCEAGETHRIMPLIETLRTTHYRSGVETQANIHFVR